MKIEQKFAKSFQISSPYRKVLVQQCFQYEITDHPSSLTDGSAIYHSNISDLLKRLREIDGVKISKPKYGDSAIT